jgi:hypothetical protein
MIKIYCSFLLLVGFVSKSIAQTQVTIRSAADSTVLSYATILDIANNKLSSADKNGSCTLSTDDKHTYRITYIGFNTIEFNLNATSTNQTVYILPKKEMMKMVVLAPCVLTKKYKINNEKKRDGATFGGTAWSGKETLSGNNAKFAVHLISSKSWAKLQTLSFWLVKSWPNTPKYAFQSPLILSFYSTDEITKTPSELLYEKPIFINPKVEGKQTIELDSMGINLPKEGIFICFELISDTAYQWKTFYKDTVTIHQGARIAGTFTEGLGFVFFNYKTNKWFHPTGFDIMNPNKLRGNLKLETTFKICKEK